MIKDGFTKIYYGFIFIILDIRFRQIDIILPDFVGYILITTGLGLLMGFNPRFRKAKIFATIMIFLSLADLVEIKQTVSKQGYLTYWYNPLFLIKFAGTIVGLVMVWHICQGIIELAKAKGNIKLVEVASARWKLYLLFEIILGGSSVFFFVVPGIFLIIVLPLVIFGLVVMFQMMGLMKRASQELS